MAMGMNFADTRFETRLADLYDPDTQHASWVEAGDSLDAPLTVLFEATDSYQPSKKRPYPSLDPLPLEVSFVFAPRPKVSLPDQPRSMKELS
jgi:hypothetical protein